MEQSSGRKSGLLRRYALESSQAAFAELVERHIGLVYSTCYRELGHRELAEEATQAVFITLAEKAGGFRSETGLVSWLYQTAQFKASTLRRQEQTRMAKEHQAGELAMRQAVWQEGDAWRRIEPALNDAINSLSVVDQQAILLRFFEERSLREVGLAMGTNEAAAQRRVSRAVEKLRSALADRKAAMISSVALAALLTKHATYAVPAHLPAAVAQSAGAIASFRSPSLARRGLRGGSSRGGSVLNPILGKGLLIVSTTKLIAGGVAAVVVILGLTFFAVHRLHSAPTTGVIYQAPPAAPGMLPSVVWQAPPGPDSATQQAEQQINALLTRQTDALNTGNEQEYMATFSPDLRHMYSAPIHPPKHFDHWQLMVTSCTVTGDTAVLHLYIKLTKQGQIFHQSRMIMLKVGMVGGKWLIVE